MRNKTKIFKLTEADKKAARGATLDSSMGAERKDGSL